MEEKGQEREEQEEEVKRTRSMRTKSKVNGRWCEAVDPGWAMEDLES